LASSQNEVPRNYSGIRQISKVFWKFLLRDPASCDRVIFGVIGHLNRSWEKTPLKQFTQLC
jgi:hypothetical protein